MAHQADSRQRCPTEDMHYVLDEYSNSRMTLTFTDRYIVFTIIPSMRPKDAPIAIDGTKMPAGTLAPYEMMTKPMRTTVASSNELTICHCTDVL